jgi:hypothetical protein
LKRTSPTTKRVIESSRQITTFNLETVKKQIEAMIKAREGQ